MRYLYGDSAPFPPQYDFLAALDVFCTQGARVVRSDSEARSLRKAVDDAAAVRSLAIDELEAFHREAVGALTDGAQDSAQPLVTDYVQRVNELAQRILDDARRGAAQSTETEQRGATVECEKRRFEVRDALEKLLIAVRLPVAETQVTMTMTGGQNELAGVFCYENGLVASFTLGGSGLDEWRQPKRISDFVKGVTLPVGVKRSLFKRTVAADSVVLDDYIIGGFDLQDERAEIRLRKRPEHSDSLIFTVKRGENRVTAEVQHPDDAAADEGLSPELDPEAAVEVERVWHLLRAACAPALVHKERLVRLMLGDADVFATEQATKVVSLVVGAISGIVGEVARRSPSPEELSLKVENDTGRREEIYLKKAQLETVLATVAPSDRGVFQPLGLVAT